MMVPGGNCDRPPQSGPRCLLVQSGPLCGARSIASSFDYLLKVRTADIHSYRRVLGEKISSLPHVASTSTFVVMESIIDAGP